jgi:hypothetical protein
MENSFRWTFGKNYGQRILFIVSSSLLFAWAKSKQKKSPPALRAPDNRALAKGDLRKKPEKICDGSKWDNGKADATAVKCSRQRR